MSEIENRIEQVFRALHAIIADPDSEGYRLSMWRALGQVRDITFIAAVAERDPSEFFDLDDFSKELPPH